MEPTVSAAGVPADRSVAGRGWTRGDVVLTAAMAAIFVANAVLSLAIRSPMQWTSGPVLHYALHAVLALAGLNLVAVPAVTVLDELKFADASAFFSMALLMWGLGVASIVAVLLVFRDVPLRRRVAYAYFIGAQVTGFAAVHWSTLGN